MLNQINQLQSLYCLSGEGDGLLNETSFLRRRSLIVYFFHAVLDYENNYYNLFGKIIAWCLISYKHNETKTPLFRKVQLQNERDIFALGKMSALRWTAAYKVVLVSETIYFVCSLVAEKKQTMSTPKYSICYLNWLLVLNFPYSTVTSNKTCQ